MGLRDIVIRTKTISVEDTTFEVRGVSMNDLMVAASDYGPQLSLIFTKLQSGSLDTTDVKSAILGLLREFPEVLAAVICLAADDYEPAMVKKMCRVPMGVTVEALEAIFGLTFASEADVKKLMESLTRMMAAGSGALTVALGPTSGTGIGASAAA